MRRSDAVASSGAPVIPVHATVAALSALLVGIGLARFAYTPLIPALIAAGWVSPSEAAYLGAANLAGYLAGALAARWLALRAPAALVLRGAMLLATATFFASSVPLAFGWLFLGRFAAGLSGGLLMVLAAPTVLAHVPPARRGLAGGLIFTGVGIGIAASGTLVPILLRAGLTETWCGLGAASLLLTGIAWQGWPGASDGSAAAALAPGGARPARSPALIAVWIAYGLNGAGLVPHFVFLVDFVARGLGRGLEAGAGFWILFGLGALAGPVVAGALSDRIGFTRAVRVGFLAQGIAVAVPALDPGPAALAVSSVVMGAFAPGISTLVLGRLNELLARDRASQPGAWSTATTAFAVGQAVAAYGLSFLFGQTGSYGLLFGLGAATLLAALAVEVVGTGLGAGRDRLPGHDDSGSRPR